MSYRIIRSVKNTVVSGEKMTVYASDFIDPNTGEGYVDYDEPGHGRFNIGFIAGIFISCGLGMCSPEFDKNIESKLAEDYIRPSTVKIRVKDIDHDNDNEAMFEVNDGKCFYKYSLEYNKQGNPVARFYDCWCRE